MSTSHKGQNGRLMIIGGSGLFHAASMWSLQVASRIVDLVHYASVKENNQIVRELKKEFRNGIVVPRSEIEEYITEDDCVLIGPGMVRTENAKIKNQKSKPQIKYEKLNEILKINEEGVQTYYLTKYLLQKYPEKKWVIDAGALQMLDFHWIPSQSILTPHKKEFTGLISRMMNDESRIKNLSIEEQVKKLANQYKCTVLLKGEEDVVASPEKMEVIKGGNAGMTKGGTGDVLAGLVAALYCKNDGFTSAVAASLINKHAGDELFEKKGYWYNASDLADQIPRTMRRLILDS